MFLESFGQSIVTEKKKKWEEGRQKIKTTKKKKHRNKIQLGVTDATQGAENFNIYREI